MVIDNFSLIKDFLTFDYEGDVFYFVQLIQRKKDNVGHHRVIMNYYITSLQYLEDREQEIKDLCKLFKARAYINLNPCSFEKCCNYAFKELADIHINNCHRSIINLMSSLAGKYSGGGDNKLWLIDYDSKDEEGINKISEIIKKCPGKEGEDVHKVHAIIPTKNGFHLIATPFHVAKFQELSKSLLIEPMDIHKNSPTLLYYAET